MTSTVREFWDGRAALGPLAGTNDYHLTTLERAVILKHVSAGMRVLDAGCGTGDTLAYLASRTPIDGLGIDFSPAMIARAVPREGLTFQVHDVTQSVPRGPFDLIYTQRMLINLPDWPTQQRVIEALGERLALGGCLLMVESSHDGLTRLNILRSCVGLPEIVAPWHNRYLRQAEMRTVSGRQWHHQDEPVDFSASYYFMSRILNALDAQQKVEEPSYDAPINWRGVERALEEIAGAKTCPLSGCGQTWYWRWGR